MYYKNNEQLLARILDVLGYMNNFLANKGKQKFSQSIEKEQKLQTDHFLKRIFKVGHAFT